MEEKVLLAFGRGLVKLLISLMVGAGVGLVTFGLTVMDKPDIWQQRDPPAELFLGIGAGVLSAAALMLVLFFVWPRRGPQPESGRGVRPSHPDPDAHFTGRPPR